MGDSILENGRMGSSTVSARTLLKRAEKEMENGNKERKSDGSIDLYYTIFHAYV
jgi:hypothetical protein